MLKSKLVTGTIATSLFTVMLSTGVFAEEATLDVQRVSENGSKYTHTYHFSDGYRIGDTTKDDYGLDVTTLYVPEGSAIQVEYPKNLYTVDTVGKVYAGGLDPAIPEMNMYDQATLWDLYNMDGEIIKDKTLYKKEDIVWDNPCEVLMPNFDSKTFSDNRYITQSEKVILESGHVLSFYDYKDYKHDAERVNDIEVANKRYNVEVDLKAPKVDASKFVLTPGTKAPSTSNTKTTTTTNTNKTTTTTKVTTPTYSVTVNGKASTATPIVQKGVSFVPARDFVEKSLGGKVDYNAKKGTLTVYANKKVVTFTEGSSYYFVDGVKKSLPANSKLVRKNNTLYVPVKPVCQSLGFSVGYDKASNAIVVK